MFLTMMNAPNRLTVFQILFLTTFILSAFSAPSIASSDSYGLIVESSYSTAQDDYGPDIFDWGFDGIMGIGSPVTAWANVSSEDPGLLNVSLVVTVDHVDTSMTLMTSNGTYYTLITDMLSSIHYFHVAIESFDISLNRTVSETQAFNLYDDNLRPDIHWWGIDGTLGNSTPVTAWANVSDEYPGLLNVSLVVTTDKVDTSKTLMISNGTYHTLTTDMLSTIHHFRIWIEAFDKSLNHTVSFAQIFNLSVDLRPDIHSWGFDGNVGSDAIVTVWANASDENPGLLNVSLVVTIDHVDTSKTLMTSNGTYYTLTTNMFSSIHYFRVWIEAFDKSLNQTFSMAQVFNLYDDDLRPDIHSWGVEGDFINENFTVWADVTDSVSGVLLVRVMVRNDTRLSIIEYMIFNGTYYTVELPQLTVNHIYSIWIESFDNALNFAESYTQKFDLTVVNTLLDDPWLTAPIVVPASLAMFGCVVTVAYFKHKRDASIAVSSSIDSQVDFIEEEETRTHLLDELERDR